MYFSSVIIIILKIYFDMFSVNTAAFVFATVRAIFLKVLFCVNRNIPVCNYCSCTMQILLELMFRTNDCCVVACTVIITNVMKPVGRLL